MNDQIDIETPRNIFVVDDDPITLRIEAKMLRDWGYKATPIISGREAIEAVKSDPPDLIILDINMPEMDGYEVCEALKSDPGTASIPVIFISAYNETAEKVKAFKSGGVDYITKPFQADEVRARLATHLALVEKARALTLSYEELRKSETMRDAMINMVIHDLRSPLTAIGLSMEYLYGEARDALSDDTISLIDESVKSVKWMGFMVNSMLDLHKLETGRISLTLSDVDLAATTREAVKGMRDMTTNCALVSEPFPGSAMVRADREVLFRMVQALVGNTVKIVPDGATVRVGLREEPGFFMLRVRDDGPPIPPEFHEMLFDKYRATMVRAMKKSYSTGLGLPFCKAAAEAHGGRVGLESHPGKGNTFWILLPVSPGSGL
ncbi:MAG: hybrid sensor histidine kinase/response regulator [Deltaproteobacteria bacterium]|nr:hybrid sensor histidine kinase/response regulator [Deltaproteobacteria bacterium]